jgi:hypothetical protein
MKKTLAIVLLVALVACGRQHPTQEGKPGAQSTTTTVAASNEPGALELTCAAFANATGASLEARFGAANVVQQSIAGAEGAEAPGTVLFPNNPARRVEIIWNDTAGRTHPANVSVTGTEGQHSDWTGPSGLVLGEALTDVERANGGAFMLYGFDWDYGGLVTDWRGGALHPAGICTVHVGFQPSADVGAAAGDSAFRSDSSEMRGARPYVSEIGVSYVGDAGGDSSSAPDDDDKTQSDQPSRKIAE